MANSKVTPKTVKPAASTSKWELLAAYMPELPYLKGEVLAVREECNGSFALNIECGDIAFVVPVSAKCFKENFFLKGDMVRMEYEKGMNIFAKEFKRVFREPNTCKAHLLTGVSHG